MKRLIKVLACTVIPLSILGGTSAASASSAPSDPADEPIPVCLSGLYFDLATETCLPGTHTLPLTYLNPQAPCTVVGDWEGQFSEFQMAPYIECFLPMMEEWIDATYSAMPHPNGYYLVPRGVETGISVTIDGKTETACPMNDLSLAYCMLDGNVYFGEAIAWTLYSQHGDGSMMVLGAHEVGHRFQHVAGFPPRIGREQIPRENQADCAAGVFMRYAANKGWMNVADDLVDLSSTLVVAASAEGPDRDHGTIDERIAAFNIGWFADNGMYACVVLATEVVVIT
jgi:uncharacterized protein